MRAPTFISVHQIMANVRADQTEAYKRKYGYARDNFKYQLFLKKHILSVSPDFYSVISARHIDTPDGSMMAVEIRAGALESPDYQPIAECFLNNEYIYLWQDRCWSVAVDKYKRDLMTGVIGSANGVPKAFDKDLILYEIGSDKVE